MKFVPNETTTKLIMLYIFQKLNIPLTENSIVDVFTSKNDWVKYIDYKNYLTQLLENGLVRVVGNSKTEPRYTISESGNDCLFHFKGKIPVSIKESIEKFAAANRDEIKLSQENTYEYYQNRDGTYDVKLKIKNVGLDENLLEMSIKVPAKANAVYLCKNWPHKAEQLYEYLYKNYIECDPEGNEEFPI